MSSEEGGWGGAKATEPKGSARLETKGVVPVLGGRSQPVDGGMKLGHAPSHGVAGGIGVKAAVDGQTLKKQEGEPGRVRSGAGGEEATVVWRLHEKVGKPPHRR